MGSTAKMVGKTENPAKRPAMTPEKALAFAKKHVDVWNTLFFDERGKLESVFAHYSCASGSPS